jgi:putative cell wall-binding protein
MTSRSIPAACGLAAVLLLAVLGPAAPAAAHPLSHGGGTVITNVTPAAGEVVAAGTVTIGALAASGQQIVEHRLEVDGVEVPATRTGTDPTHPVIVGAVELAPGSHVVRLAVDDASGRQTIRLWRFTVSPMGQGRLFGTGRVETAVAISQNLYPHPGSASAAVLARADEFADALAGVPGAAAVDGPLLLTGSSTLAPAAADELSRILHPGAPVYLLGGAGALSAAVEQAVAARGFEPRRLAGESRFDTAAAVAALAPDPSTVFVASGERFPDALAASSPAAMAGHPILLTGRDRLPEATRAFLAPPARLVRTVLVVGGTAAVSDAVVLAIRAQLPAAEVVRLAGESRFDTAAVVAARFFPQAPTVAVASGERFPDALAGGRHAAARGAPLLLTSGTAVPGPQLAQVRAWASEQSVVYGGLGAVSRGVAADVLRARLDADGPGVIQLSPAAGSRLGTLDQIVLAFDRPIAREHSVLSASLGGDEVAGVLAPGEFADSLVFTVGELPAGIVPGQDYEVRVTGAIADPELRFTHIDVRLRYRKLDLSRGDSGVLVRTLQERLQTGGYWLGRLDGVYGNLTHQAVMAFQKVHGLPVDGTYNAATRQALEAAPPRPRPASSSGRVIEIDLVKQVLYVVTHGQVDWVFNTSTGHGGTYVFNGQTYRATTTTGQLRIVREIDGMREAERGLLWRPKYFDNARGIAIHGATSVPATPASAGCVRLTYAAMDFIWDSGLAPIGTPVWVYPADYYG